MTMDVVTRTWAELGKRLRVFGTNTLVRTDKVKDTTEGGIVLPKTDFYKGMPHVCLIGATVLAVGPKAAQAGLSPGDRVCFQRLYFSRYEVLEDRTFVGWVDSLNLAGRLEGEFYAQLG